MYGVLALLLACSDTQKTNEQNTNGNTPKAQEEKKAGFQELDLKQIEEASEKVELVPSPLKMQAEIEKAGISDELATFIRKEAIKTDVEDKEQLAIRCGILLTDLTLSIKRTEPPVILSQLTELKKGMNTLKTGSDIQTVIQELINTVQKPNFDRNAMLQELDDLASVLIPEIKHESEEWIVPLIQAGTWIEGIHLVSSAAVANGKVKDLSFLKQPGVARYFLRYVDREGRTKAPPVVMQKVKATLQMLEKVAKQDKISQEDLKSVQSETKTLLTFI